MEQIFPRKRTFKRNCLLVPRVSLAKCELIPCMRSPGVAEEQARNRTCCVVRHTSGSFWLKKVTVCLVLCKMARDKPCFEGAVTEERDYFMQQRRACRADRVQTSYHNLQMLKRPQKYCTSKKKKQKLFKTVKKYFFQCPKLSANVPVCL